MYALIYIAFDCPPFISCGGTYSTREAAEAQATHLNRTLERQGILDAAYRAVPLPAVPE